MWIGLTCVAAGHDGLNNVGLVLAVIGEKIHDLGVWLADL